MTTNNLEISKTKKFSEKEMERFQKMLLIRRFEESVLKLFDQGKIFGTTHCYIGQEANAVGVIEHLKPTDIIWSNHRCHGHYLAFYGDIEGILAELMGKETGIVGGRGGSQHICRESFYSNGVQGGIVPAAAGMAYAEKIKKSDKIVTVFIGDGTLGEGVVYETLNMASLLDLPILIVVENNRYAQSTRTSVQVAGDMAARSKAFGIETTELDTFDVNVISDTAEGIVNKVRSDKKPQVLILNTYRFCHHSKSDDNRDQNEVEQWKQKDPLLLFTQSMDPKELESIENDLSKKLEASVSKALAAPFPKTDGVDLDEALEIS